VEITKSSLETVVKNHLSLIDTAFWQSKKVLITGHTGFKGGWLALWLSSLGARVSGYALPPPTTPSFYESTHLHKTVHTTLADIRSMDDVVQAFQSVQPDIVFHLAAQPLVRASYTDPLETFSTNTQGTANVLEAIRRTPSVQASVIITTDKVYENREWVWNYRENDALGGYDPYSASKAASEIIVNSYRHSYFSANGTCAVASARAGNVIGGGDWAADRIIPDIIHAITHSVPLTLRYPNAIRPWQHVLDPLAGYVILAQHLYCSGKEYAEAWNFGPSDDVLVTVGEMVDVVNTLWGGNRLTIRVADDHQQLHETTFLRLDCAKSLRRLSWKAQLPVQEAIRLTVDWYKHFLDGKTEMYEYSLLQIQQYHNLLEQQATQMV
jgi:CDP-glucose 4,6-dehydratase